MNTLIVTAESIRAELQQQLAEVEAQIANSANKPRTINLSMGPLSREYRNMGVIGISDNCHEALADIVNLSAVATGADLTMRAGRMLGLIMDIDGELQSMPEQHQVKTQYLIDGPNWWVAAVTTVVKGRFALVTPFTQVGGVQEQEPKLININ